MPLIRFDLVEGRSPEELKTLLGSAHRAMVDAFEVPERDRYQAVHEHPARQLVVQDTGLGFERSDKVVLVSVTSRKRTQEAKLKFYKNLVREHAGVEPEDVMVSIVENGDADWSFGQGRAQFITGEL